MSDNRTKEAVVFGIEAMIACLKVAKIPIDDLEQRAFAK